MDVLATNNPGNIRKWPKSMDQIKANACKRSNQRQNNETTLLRNIAIEYYMISEGFWFTMVFVLRNVK